MSRPDWSSLSRDERVAAIKRAWWPKASARKLAACLGTTRGAIIGYYDRYPEALHDHPLLAKSAIMANNSNGIVSRVLKKKVAAYPTLPKEPLPPGGGCDLIALDHSRCRWPLLDTSPGQDQRFCGLPAYRGARTSYCEHHFVRSIRQDKDAA